MKRFLDRIASAIVKLTAEKWTGKITFTLEVNQGGIRSMTVSQSEQFK